MVTDHSTDEIIPPFNWNEGILLVKNEHRKLVAKCSASWIFAKAWCEAKGRYLAWATQINKENSIEPQYWAEVTMLQEKAYVNEIMNCGKNGTFTRSYNL